MTGHTGAAASATVPDAARTVMLRAARGLDAAARGVLRLGGSRWPALTRAHDGFILRRRMRRALGYRPRLRDPRSYNEKLGWRMLYDRNPLLPITTDKWAVREYVAGKVGADILTPVLGVYDRAAEIPWDDLPEQFVLKANHGCAMNIIVRDKATEDRDRICREADAWLTRNFYEESREWAYSRIRPRLLIEELLVDTGGELPFDYKFMVFHGRVAMIRVHLDRFGDHRVNFHGRDLELLPIRQEYPVDAGYRPPPEVRQMIGIAEKLAEDFDYARIDLYLVAGRVRFGEITHYDGNGTQRFRPAEMDRRLGDLWQIPAATR